MFGADLPVEGGQGCQFSWCDGPLLLALKSGSWIVLDEVLLLLYSKNVRCQKIKKVVAFKLFKKCLSLGQLFAESFIFVSRFGYDYYYYFISSESCII